MTKRIELTVMNKSDTKPAWKAKWLDKMESDPVKVKWYRLLQISKRLAKVSRREIETVTVTQWLEILKSYDYKCGDCGTNQIVAVGFKLDPYFGGNFEADNLIPICRECWGASW